MVTAGYGTRHPALVEFLERSEQVASEEQSWGDFHLRMTAYGVPYGGPDELVTSVRCVVVSGDQVLLCETPDGPHLVPGGRRLPGESLESTARRELHEETGCSVGSLKDVGFLHVQHLGTVPHDYPYPHPDLVQIVLVGELACDLNPTWTDVEGWEQGAALVPDNVAMRRVRSTDAAFLRLARLKAGTPPAH